jgi:membrane-associated protease RseP (regulator of RpoE activity)
MQETVRNDTDLAERLRAEIGDLFYIEDVTAGYLEPGSVRFRGRLLVTTQEAYAKLRERFAPYRLTPVIRRIDEQDVLFALPARRVGADPAQVSTGKPWVNVALFLATVFTVLMAGVQQSTGNFWADLLSGWPFAVGVLGILLTHEFGHYFAARFHGVATTLPYFIPMPFSLLGTMGAVIVNRGAMRDRRTLLDIGAAGPLAGLIVAMPVLLVGLALSPVEPMGSCPPDMVCYLEGNSLLYLGAKYLVHGLWLPGEGMDVMLHPLASAGWAGVLVTMFNLLPVGTLDGGHIAYSLLGKRARLLFWPILLALGGLGFLWSGWWLWAGLLFFFGRMHAQPLDDATPLDGRRKLIAVIALAVLVLTFTPLPITFLP